MKLGRGFVLGSLYMGSGQVLTNIANLLIGIAIARFLGPEEFGVYAFCFAINEFINIVGAFSLSFALIQTEEATQSDYDTALLSCALQGLAGIIITVLVAPILGSERSLQAAWILCAMAFARVFRLLWQVPQAELSAPFATALLPA